MHVYWLILSILVYELVIQWLESSHFVTTVAWTNVVEAINVETLLLKLAMAGMTLISICIGLAHSGQWLLRRLMAALEDHVAASWRIQYVSNFDDRFSDAGPKAVAEGAADVGMAPAQVVLSGHLQQEHQLVARRRLDAVWRGCCCGRCVPYERRLVVGEERRDEASGQSWRMSAVYWEKSSTELTMGQLVSYYWLVVQPKKQLKYF